MGKIAEILQQNQDYILRSYQEGKSASALGRELNCNGGSIWTFIKKCGYATHKTTDIDSQIDNIKKLHAEGISAYQISKDLNIPLTSLARKLKKLELDISHRSKIRDDPMKNHVEEVIELYLSGINEAEISRKFHCDNSTVCRILKKYNIDTGYPYTVDNTFFDKIDTQEKAYVLGYFTADGCNHKNNTISFASIDLELLEKVKSIMKYNGPIYREEAPKKFPHRQGIYKLYISSRNISEKLSLIGGCGQRKSFTTFFPPEDLLPKHLVCHYIRGLFDGDGSIYLSNQKRYYIVFAGTYSLLFPIQNIIKIELNIDGGLYPEGNIHVLKYQSTQKSIILGDWMYTDASVYLDRKYKLYLELKKA
jgi:intein-encoded DNA endonuclease-like protein